MKLERIALGLVIILCLAVQVEAIPEPAAEFYGDIMTHGTPGVTGLNVTAFAGPVLCGQFSTQNQGYFGVLSCMGDDSAPLPIAIVSVLDGAMLVVLVPAFPWSASMVTLWSVAEVSLAQQWCQVSDEKPFPTSIPRNPPFFMENCKNPVELKFNSQYWSPTAI